MAHPLSAPIVVFTVLVFAGPMVSEVCGQAIPEEAVAEITRAQIDVPPRPELRPATPGLQIKGVHLRPTGQEGSTSALTGRLPTASERWQALRRELVSVGVLFESVGAGTWDHLSDEPASWPDGAAGYVARVGSNAGGAVLEIGATDGLAAALHLDTRFEPQQQGGRGARLHHAVVGSVTARTARGTHLPNVPQLAGSYGAALAQQRWELGETRPGEAAVSALISIGFDVVENVVVEFAGGE